MKSLKLSFYLALFLPIIGCSPAINIVDTSCSGYKSHDFHRNEIIQKGIGIMPVLGGDEKEQFRRPMADRLFFHMNIEFGRENVRSTREVIQTLNEYGLAEDYSRALNNYQHSGILPSELIKNVGEVLNVEYLLYTRLLASRETDFVYTGRTHERVDVDELYVQTQVWSTEIGDIVWEGKGGIAHLKSADKDIVDLTAKGLVQVIGKETDGGPCENPRTLINSVQAARTNSYLVGVLAGTIFFIIVMGL